MKSLIFPLFAILHSAQIALCAAAAPDLVIGHSPEDIPDALIHGEENPYGIEFQVNYDYELYNLSEEEIYAKGPLTFSIKTEEWVPILLFMSSWQAYQSYGEIRFLQKRYGTDYNVGEWWDLQFTGVHPETFFLIGYLYEEKDGIQNYYFLDQSFINSSDYLSEEDYKLVFPDDVNGMEAIDRQGLDIMVNEGQIMVVSADGIAPQIEIYDANGRLVMKASASSPIDISHLPKGLYIARAQSSSLSATKKFLR